MAADHLGAGWLAIVEKSPVTWKNLRRVVLEPLIEVIKSTHNEQQRRIEALEAKLTAIESKGILHYEGLYDPQADYDRGSSITFDGSVWIQRDASSRNAPPPGNGWTLAVKRGRDARDRR